MKNQAILSLMVSLLLLAANAGGMVAQADSAAPSGAPLAAPLSRPLADGKATAGVGTEPSLRVVESSERGVVLELVTPDYALQPLADGCLLLSVEGYGATDRSGWPELPLRGAMVGIPAQAQVALQVLEVESVVRRVGGNLCPAARPIVEYDAQGMPQYRGEERVRDGRAYLAGGTYPLASASLVETAYIRSQRVAQIRFQPFHYNPLSGELRHDRRIRVRVDFFPEERMPARLGTFIDEGSFEPILQSTLLNYEQARNWRVRPEPTTNPQTVWPPHEGPWYKVSLDADGIYQMDYAYLEAAGIPVDELDPRTIQMYNMGEEIAILVEGEEDGSFDAGDAVVFYGEKTDTRYTDVNVYWLTWEHAAGRRMAETDGTPSGSTPPLLSFRATHRAERNLEYYSSWRSGPDNDPWYWQMIFANKPTSQPYTTEVRYLASEPYSATVSGFYYGFFTHTPPHHVLTYLNGHLIDEATWTTNSEYAFQATVPFSYLVEGTNLISVELPLDQGAEYEGLLVNRFDIEYRRTFTAENNCLFFESDGANEYRIDGFSSAEIEAFDVTTSTCPTRILSPTVAASGNTYSLTFEQTAPQYRRFLVLAQSSLQSPLDIEQAFPTGLRSTNNAADYLVITHADFVTDTVPLVSYRAAQGLRTAIIDVADIYDEFSYGIFDPQAIRDFLAYAYANWTPPAPTYVLLVGDGNYDFKDYKGSGEPNYIPPYLDDVDPWIEETATDNHYVAVSGEDILPDMHIGRLPVQTREAVAAVIAKILDYEQNPVPGNWNQQLLFVADNADSAGDFASLSDDLIASHLPAPYQPQRVYLGITHPYQNPSVAARNAVLAAINEGRLVVDYNGHGAVSLWAGERLLYASDADALSNGRRLPFFVPMTCIEGYFIIPSTARDESCVAESMVRASGGGAIASWSPTGYGLSSGHDVLNRGLFEALFFDGIIQLGPATSYAKLYLYSNPSGSQELIETYLLFGDPAMALHVLKTDLSITAAAEPPAPVRPGDPVTYTITYTNTGPATAYHITISDILPTALVSPTVISSGAVITRQPGSPFVWDVADLAAGEGGTITITAAVSSAFGGVLSHTVLINSTAVETTTANNISALLTTVHTPDLVIAMQGPAEAQGFSVVTYTLVYSNAGETWADQVVIEDILPTGLVSATVTSSGAAITPRQGTAFVWDAVNLLPGEGGTITIAATLSATMGVLVNTATIANATFEVRQENNTATVFTQVGYLLYLPLITRRHS